MRNIVCYFILIGSFENVWSIVTKLGCPKSRMDLTCGRTVGPTFLHAFWGWTNSWSTLGYKCHLDQKFLGPSLPRTKRVGRIVTRTKGVWTKHQGTVEFGNESQMALLLQWNGGRNVQQCSHEQFVSVYSWKAQPSQKLQKCLIAACALCSQQFMVKHGVTRLHVSQFSG